MAVREKPEPFRRRIQVETPQEKAIEKVARALDIAVYHDLGPGGAKRSLVEMAAGLRKRGHCITLYCHSPENAQPSLDGVADKIVIEPVNVPAPGGVAAWLKSDSPDRIARRIGGSRPLFVARSFADYLRLKSELDALDVACKKIAGMIDAAKHDVAFVHGSMRTQCPSLMPYIKTPSLYYAQEPLRLHYERPRSKVGDPYIEAWRRATGIDEWWGIFSNKSRELRAERDLRNIRAAKAIAANSDFSRNAFKQFYGVEARTCTLAVDRDRFAQIAGVSRERAALAVGDLSPHKMHEFCVDAVAAIKKSDRPKLWIVGRERSSGAKAALIERARSRDVDMTVHDDPPDDLLVKLYNTAKVTLCAAYREPFGLTALESMSCGTPVVAVREGGFAETVSDGETGILCDRSPQPFASAMTKLLDNEKLWKKMSERCVLRAAEWNWDKAVTRIEDYLLEVAGK